MKYKKITINVIIVPSLLFQLHFSPYLPLLQHTYPFTVPKGSIIPFRAESPLQRVGRFPGHLGDWKGFQGWQANVCLPSCHLLSLPSHEKSGT